MGVYEDTLFNPAGRLRPNELIGGVQQAQLRREQITAAKRMNEQAALKIRQDAEAADAYSHFADNNSAIEALSGRTMGPLNQDQAALATGENGAPTYGGLQDIIGRQATRNKRTEALAENRGDYTRTLGGISPRVLKEFRDTEAKNRKGVVGNLATEKKLIQAALSSTQNQAQYDLAKEGLHDNGVDTSSLPHIFSKRYVEGLNPNNAFNVKDSFDTRFKALELRSKAQNRREVNRIKEQHNKELSRLKRMKLSKKGNENPTVFKKELHKLQARSLSKSMESLPTLRESINGMDRMVELIRKGPGLQGRVDSQTSWLTDHSARVRFEQAVANSQVQTLIKSFKGMSRSIDSVAERKIFNESQISASNNEATNLGVALARKDALQQMVKMVEELQTYAAEHGNLDNFKSKYEGYLGIMSPRGEILSVHKREHKKLRKQGFKSFDKYASDLDFSKMDAPTSEGVTGGQGTLNPLQLELQRRRGGG